MNQKRSRLQKLHAKSPVEHEDSEAMLNWKTQEKSEEEPAVVTIARPSEYGVKSSASTAKSTSATDRDRMKKKFQHTKMKESFDMMENGGQTPVKNEQEECTTAKSGKNRQKATQLGRWSSSYMSDGKRLIDFVLAYEPKNEKDEPGEDEEDTITVSANGISSRSGPAQSHSDKRRIFETNLHTLGLELEFANATQGNTKFVLVHAPFKVLLKQAELLMIRKPVHRNDVRKEVNLMDGCINAFLKRLKFLDFKECVKKRIEPDEYFCQPFVVQHMDCFVGYENQETFFSRGERARMVHDLLIRARYDRGTNMNKLRFGIERLVRNNVYSAAYPIHEDLNTKAKKVNFETCSDRQLLYETWVRLTNLFKYQPLDLVQKYYGTKIAFYFAWLGFYTRCLYSVSLIGVICVIYGIVTMNNDIPNNDICSEKNVDEKHPISHELLCPICPNVCDFIPLNKTCFFSRLTYVFDNYATIFFTIVMSIWMTVFLEFWKRYHAQLAYRWNVLGYEPDEEVVRPEFQYRRTKMKINPVTKQEEPYVSITEKAFRLCGSAITVLFFVSLVIALLFGIIVYRIIIRQVVYASSSDDFAKQYTIFIFTSTTAASINLVFILIMNYFYNKLALKLTNWECPRTQSEFDNSFTFKVFLFQFVNFYSSLFYIAFIKGKFAGIPGNPKDYADPHEMRIGTIRLEQCDAAGCMVELLIQLIVIMVGKQLLNGFFELAYPMFCYWFRRWRLKLPETKKQRMERISKEKRKTIKEKPGISLYEKDYTLNSVNQQFLFDEYLEMVIQLGFCSLFVAAFPLAPLFALINNIFEIRFDAYKFIVTTRRPVPEQARNIGIWLTIINMISNVAVLCNAFVIAFTSDFIPKFYYQMTQGTLHGYLNDTLAYFDTDNLELDNTLYGNPPYCRYYDLRRPPCSLAYKDVRFHEMREFCSDNYEFNPQWWVILSLRLIFVLVFELIVLSIKAIFAYIIPDMPTKIIKQLQRERYLMRQAILERRDSMPWQDPEILAAEKARADPTVVADVEVHSGIDRPEWKDVDMNDSIIFEPGRQNSTGPQSSPAVSLISKDVEFEGLKRLFTNRERPSLSPHASRQDLTVISIDEPIEKSTSSEPALYHPQQGQKQPKPAVKRWPTPSLLVVPPTNNSRRPRTVEVLQKASQHLKNKSSEEGEDREKDIRNDSDEIV